MTTITDFYKFFLIFIKFTAVLSFPLKLASNSFQNQHLVMQEEGFIGHCGNGFENTISWFEHGKNSESSRSKRDVQSMNFPKKFDKSRISWNVVDKSLYLKADDIDNMISKAFDIWAQVAPLEFYHNTTSPDIVIRFGSGLHGDCPVKFDENGSQLGHSWTVGEVHINDAVSRLHPGMLPHVAVHELGHALGLAHDEDDPTAIMHSVYYTKSDKNPGPAPAPGPSSSPPLFNIRLSQSDIHAIQGLYGECVLGAQAIADLRVRKSMGGGYPYSFISFRTQPSQSSLLTLHSNFTFPDTTTAAVKAARQGALSFSRLPYALIGLLQLGKSDNNVAYAVTQDLMVYTLSVGETVEVEPESIPEAMAEKWPCFGGSHDLELLAMYYNRRDRNIYFYSGASSNYLVYRYNSKKQKCLQPMSFDALHINDESPLTTTDTPSTTTESFTDDTVTNSEYPSGPGPGPGPAPDYLKWGSRENLSINPSANEVRLVFQVHSIQETYLMTDSEVWRIRKSDYTLEYKGTINKYWPFLCANHSFAQ